MAAENGYTYNDFPVTTYFPIIGQHPSGEVFVAARASSIPQGKVFKVLHTQVKCYGLSQRDHQA